MLLLTISKNKRGQALLLSLVVLLVLVMFMLTIVNVGQITTEKMRLQNSADAAAYSAAVMEARALNYTAYTNRARLAHLINIAQLTALHSYSEYAEKLVRRCSLPADPFAVLAGRSYRVTGPVMRKGVLILDTEIKAMRIAQDAMFMLTATSLFSGRYVSKVAKEYESKKYTDKIENAWGPALNIKNSTRFKDTKKTGDRTVMLNLVKSSLGSFSRGTHYGTRRNYFFPCLSSGFVWCFPMFKKWITKWASSNVSVDDIKSSDSWYWYRVICIPTLWGVYPVPIPLPWTLKKTKASASEFGFSGMPEVIMYNKTEKGISVYTYFFKDKKYLFGSDEKISGLDTKIEHITKKEEGFSKRKARGLEPNWKGNRLNAFSKALVYYNRPDKPSEKENLFNPFWNARLATLEKDDIKYAVARSFSGFVTH